MSPPDRCSFCQELPPASPGRATAITKCPVCKGELLTLAGGQVCRPGDATVLPRRRKLVALAAIFAVAAGALALRSALTPERTEQGPAVAAGAPGIFDPGSPAPRVPGTAEPVQLAAPSPATDPAPADPSALAALPKRKVEPQPPPQEPAAAPEPPPKRQRGDLIAVRHKHSRPAQQAELETQLAYVPIIGLDKGNGKSDPKEARRNLEERAKKFLEVTKKSADGLVDHLTATRADLVGMPFLKGEACKLDPKESEAFQQASHGVRLALDRVSRPSTRGLAESPSGYHSTRFMEGFDTGPGSRKQPSIVLRVLHQVLMAEDEFFRAALADHLARPGRDAGAATVLAARAVFDTAESARARAVAALANYDAKDYRDKLVAALRHPWPAAAQHAAEALVALEHTDVVAELVKLLEEPSPNAPFPCNDAKESGMAVRELVRVNHLGNCMLCHAPVARPTGRAGSALSAPVPVAGEPVPPSRTVYYSSSRSSVFVRADVTYLRQDFSVMQPVAEHGAWPQYQRFDFLVRTRHLTKAEVEKHRGTQAGGGLLWMRTAAADPTAANGHRRAAHFALVQLTGHDAGPTAEAWRRWIRENGWRADRDPVEWRVRNARPCER